MSPFAWLNTAPFVVGLTASVIAGAALGTASGLVPGLHANNFALLLAAAAPTIDSDPLFVGTAMLAAGVVHSFLDIVPALALGVPDAAMAIAALPGHRLVLAGRGREALRLSALGSLVAVVLAIPLSVPITAAMVRLYPTIRSNLAIVLGGIVCLLVVTERSPRRALAALGLLAASGALGIATLDVNPDAPLGAGSMLVPLLSGLFGAPVLIDALDGAGVPPQDGAELLLSRRRFLGTAGAGSIAGAIVGYLPGVSAAIASVLALPAVPAEDVDRGFIVVTSGASTSNTVFALCALVALGTPRTGVTVAMDNAGVPLELPVLLVTVVIAACAGFLGVVMLGDRVLAVIGSIEPEMVSSVVLVLLVGLSAGFAGIFGAIVFPVATLLGLVPPRVGVRRVTLMGVLIGPLLVG